MKDSLKQVLNIFTRRFLKSTQQHFDFFSSLFMNMPSGVAISNVEHEIQAANKHWLDMFGYKMNEVFGKTVFELISNPDEQKQSLKKLKHSSQHKSLEAAVRFNAIRYRSDKSPIHTNITVVPIYISGEIICHFGIYRDVTAEVEANEQRELVLKNQEITIKERTREIEEIKQFFETVLETLGESVFVEDKKGFITYTNPAASRLLGFKNEEIIGMQTSALIDPEDHGNVKRRIKYRRNRGPATYETILIGKTNRRIPVLINATGKQEGNTSMGNVMAITDFSTIKKVQKDLESAVEKAKAADKAKSEFLANMSHEIRTPLNGVIGMAELLSDTELTDEQIDYLRTIKTSGDTLLVVINDILDFSKIEAGKLEIEEIEFHLNSLVDDTMKALALKAYEKGVEVIYEIDDGIPAFLIGDPGRIRQILNNLVGNAIKFTDKGMIHVTLTPKRLTKNVADIRFCVKDTGIGIKPKDLKKLFKSFHQADASTTRKFGGTGLGLAISRQLTELMGGQIHAASQYGKGSEFVFNIKVQVQSNPLEIHKPLLMDVSGMGVLIVDDVAANRKILRAYLEKLGFDVEDADSARTGLKIAELAAKLGKPFPIIISDYNMPAKDGAWFGKKIRADIRYNTSKLILLTSRGMPGEAKRMKEIGYDVFLSKPIRQSDIFDAIMMVLSGGKSNQTTLKKELITKHSILDSKIPQTRILVVDDNPINLKIAKSQLNKLGFQFDLVQDGPGALKKLAAEEFDLVLMDRQMPVMGGIECTMIIRKGGKNVQNSKVPIIALTADAMKDAKDQCLEAGMNGYITKPIKMDALFEEIKRVLWPDMDTTVPSKK